jgi:hypothetical protein
LARFVAAAQSIRRRLPDFSCISETLAKETGRAFPPQREHEEEVVGSEPASLRAV